MENEFLDSMEVGQLVHMHANHISRLASQGVIPSIKVGRKRLFKRKDVLRWMKEQNQKRKGR